MTVSNRRLEKDSNGQWVWKYDVEYTPNAPKRKSRLDNEDKDLSELFGVTKP